MQSGRLLFFFAWGGEKVYVKNQGNILVFVGGEGLPPRRKAATYAT
jgi:hypothetical protein